MNLAQCIPPEWAQEGCKPRAVWVPLAGDLQARRDVVGRDADHLPLTEPKVAPAPELPERRVPVPQAPRPAVTHRVLGTPEGQRRGPVRRSESVMWPRGKRGDRFEILKVLGRAFPQALVSARICELSKVNDLNKACSMLRLLAREGWVERGGEFLSYNYRLTDFGRKALESPT